MGIASVYFSSWWTGGCSGISSHGERKRRSLTDRLNDSILRSNKGGQRIAAPCFYLILGFLDFHSHLRDLTDHHKSCIYIFVSRFVSFSEHFISSAENSIQRARYPS